jgi:hypothetical protein
MSLLIVGRKTKESHYHRQDFCPEISPRTASQTMSNPWIASKTPKNALLLASFYEIVQLALIQTCKECS